MSSILWNIAVRLFCNWAMPVLPGSLPLSLSAPMHFDGLCDVFIFQPNPPSHGIAD